MNSSRAFSAPAFCVRMSCPAKAGHPVIVGKYSVARRVPSAGRTGSPAFAGDDSRMLSWPEVNALPPSFAGVFHPGRRVDLADHAPFLLIGDRHETVLGL